MAKLSCTHFDPFQQIFPTKEVKGGRERERKWWVRGGCRIIQIAKDSGRGAETGGKEKEDKGEVKHVRRIA